jgi:hypothetical protein
MSLQSLSLERIAQVFSWLVGIETSDFDPYERHIAYVYGVRFLSQQEVEISISDLARVTGASKTKCHHARKILMETRWLVRDLGQHKNECARVRIGDVRDLDPEMASYLNCGIILCLGDTLEKLEEML